MTEVDIKNITEKLNKAEIIIKEKETEIAVLRAQLKDTEKIEESEMENKENDIKELKDKNQQLTESLESAKQQLAQMKKQIEILEGEKENLKEKLTTLESYINEGGMNPQLQKVLEDIKNRIEGTY
jgi:chromosome segregation ATPase